MTDVLLEVLNDSDIDWMVAVGEKRQLEADQIIIQQGDVNQFMYIVLNGALAATISDDKKSAMGRAFLALSDDSDVDLEREISRFSSGEIVGETSFLSNHQSALTIKTFESSVILALPYGKLQARLSQDLDLASRFYRATAVLLLQRFNRLLKNFSKRRGLQIPPIQDGPLLFGELNDSDVDWLISKGSVADIPDNQILIQSGRAVSNLYIVLRGTLSLSMPEARQGAIGDVFSRLQEKEVQPVGREVARVSQGEIVGETTLLESRLSPFNVKTIESCKLLILPIQEISLKMQRDAGMAARFYRILSILLSNRVEYFISRLGYGKPTYESGQSLSDSVQYANEIDIDLIDSLALGGSRFDWMLKRLEV